MTQKKFRINIPPHIPNIFKGLLYYSAVPVALFIALRYSLDFAGLDYFITTLMQPKIAVMTVIFVIFLPKCIAYIACIIGWWRYKRRIRASSQDYVREKCGPPGTGKSATAGVEAVVLARHLKNMMLEKHWLLLQKSYIRPLTELEQADFEEINEAINFYQQDPSGVWGLFSTVPMRIGHRMSYELTIDHLSQTDRLPVYAVAYADEIGYVIDNDTKDSPALEPVGEMSRFTRHDGEFHLIFTEQEQKNFFKDLRRNVAYIERMRKQNNSLVPKIPLYFAKFFLFWIGLFGFKLKSPRFGIFLGKCLSFARNVGFRVFTSKKIGSEFDNDELIKKRELSIVPACLNYIYNNRTYRQSYRCINEPIKGTPWRTLLVSKEHIDRDRVFRRQAKKRSENETAAESGVTDKDKTELMSKINELDEKYDKLRRALYANIRKK